MTKAIITSARELTAEQIEKIEDKFSLVLNDMLEIEVKVDPSLIGGICVEAGGIMYDGSVRTRLSGMLKAMLTED